MDRVRLGKVDQECKGKIRKRIIDQTYLKQGKSKDEFNLKNHEDNLENWIQQAPKTAKAYITICSANIFLLNNIDFHTVKSWSSNLKDTPLESSAYEFLPYIISLTFLL